MIPQPLKLMADTYRDYAARHPITGMIVSLIMIAACIGWMYLIIKLIPRLMVIPCFTGGCSR